MPRLRFLNSRRYSITAVVFLWTVVSGTITAWGEDTIEFLSGAKLRGTVINIDKAAKKISFESKIGSRSIRRTYSYDRIHAVVLRGKRYQLNAKSDNSRPTSSPMKSTANAAAASQQRSRTELDRLIKEAGRTPPDWYESTPLDYPQTLDLSWPLKPPDKKWNNQKNVGQYLWDIVNPNPRRWRSGVKLIHQIMARHQGQSTLLRRDMVTLGGKYFELFQDYPRAAFWFRRARVTPSEGAGIMLAECYYRLGSKPMAMQLLQVKTVHPQAIKLWGDMGETRRAVQLADGAAARSNQPHTLYLMAADALRLAGQNSQAIAYYQKVLDAGTARNEAYDRRYKNRAKESIEAIRLFEQADVARVADGSYRDVSTGYNGPLAVEVQVADGKIDSVKVVQHVEKQFYAAIADTTQQIIDKQSVKGIDATSRATITSQAIVNAAAKALSQGSP